MAKLVPVDEAEDDFIGRLKGVFEVVGELESDRAEAYESSL